MNKNVTTSVLDENDIKALKKLHDQPTSVMSAYAQSGLSERKRRLRMDILERLEYVRKSKTTADGRVLKWTLTRRGVLLIEHSLR